MLSNVNNCFDENSRLSVLWIARNMMRSYCVRFSRGNLKYPWGGRDVRQEAESPVEFRGSSSRILEDFSTHNSSCRFMRLTFDTICSSWTLRIAELWRCSYPLPATNSSSDVVSLPQILLHAGCSPPNPLGHSGILSWLILSSLEQTVSQSYHSCCHQNS